MSVIVKAKISVNTKFEDKECLLKSIESLNIKYKESNNSIILIDKNITFTKQGEYYIAQYLNEYMDDMETVRGKEIRKSATKIISQIEGKYQYFLKEKIERLRKLEMERYEKEQIEKFYAEEERKKQEVLLKKEKMRLERLKKKKELEKQKLIQEKIEKLKEKAKSLGYEIEEQVKGDEKVLVFVRRR